MVECTGLAINGKNMSSVYQTYEATTPQGHTWRLEMLNDVHAESPRDSQENLGTMIYGHRRYTLGDERINEGSFQEYLEAKNLSFDKVISLPLYLYDHSGLAMSTTDFGDPWDSGCVGAIFVSHDQIKQDYGNLDQSTLDMVEGVLRAEVEEMHEYLSGNSFGMRLTQFSGDGAQIEDPEEVYGFLGSDPRTNGMIDNIPSEALEFLRPVLDQDLGRLPSQEPSTEASAPARSPRLR